MPGGTLATVLNERSEYSLVEEYLEKRFLERREWKTALINKSFGIVRPIDKHNGQWAKFTRKGRFRRPQTMPSPSGAGSDPASGASMETEQPKVPVEFLHEFIDITTVAQATSWVDLDEWAREDLPVASERRLHELVQNAMLVGRMTPGKYAADGTLTTDFDASAEATVTLYQESFTFDPAPKYYANGKETFADMDANDKPTWFDMRNHWTRLSLSGAKLVDGNYICVCSSSFWNDLLQDDDGGLLTAAIAGGMKSAIKGLETMKTFEYAGWKIIIDDQPFTEDPGAEGVRANWGKVHSALCFGKASYVWVPLGDMRQMRPKFKVQDITKTGYSHSIGYMLPYGIAVINPDWCLVYKAYVSEPKPNNFNPANVAKQLEGFGV